MIDVIDAPTCAEKVRVDRLTPWITFAGCVLVIVVLYRAQAVLVPIALG